MPIFEQFRRLSLLLPRLGVAVNDAHVLINFLANGTLGTIVPLNSLPFGLTGAALEAARQIKFTPAVKDGQPHDASKVIEYLFAIY